MSSEWQLLELSELLKIKPRNGLYKSSEFQGKGNRWVKMKDVYGTDFIRNQAMEQIVVSSDEINKFGCEDGDLLFGRTSLTLEGIGDCALVCNVPDTPIFESNLFRLRFALDKANPRFYFYFFKSVRGKEAIQSIAKQTAATSITASDLINLHVPCPSLQTQNEIAAFLGCIDDRISLLRETNTNLEAIAQALFKSWFVDFDPVHAKMQGRAPEGMDEATAALFPDSFEESELGTLPKGWSVASIYDVAKVIYGAPFASKQFKSEPPGKPLVRIRDLKDERPGVYTEEIHPKGYLLQPGDITVGMDGEFRAYVWGGEEAWLNQRVCVFQPEKGANSVFVRLSIAPLLAAVEASETATTVIHLGKNDIDRFKINHPGNLVLAAFASLTTPIYQRIVGNKQMIQNLAGLRDTLLPRLISGQLSVTQATVEADV
jgi:type I restriction enzyme S subunit